MPKLNQAAVAAGDAEIDAVSGATYTSSGYKKSLQSALDKARAAGSPGSSAPGNGGGAGSAEARGGQSDRITSDAVPKLNQAAVAAGDAEIDAVSGATYTSAGYEQSLQSALDRAGG